jgi:hypothetical protein
MVSGLNRLALLGKRSSDSYESLFSPNIIRKSEFFTSKNRITAVYVFVYTQEANPDRYNVATAWIR